MSCLIKKAVHVLDSVVEGHDLAHWRVTVKEMSKAEPPVWQESCKFSSQQLWALELGQCQKCAMGLGGGVINGAGMSAWLRGSSGTRQASHGHGGSSPGLGTCLVGGSCTCISTLLACHPSAAPHCPSGSGSTHHRAQKPLWSAIPNPPCPFTPSPQLLRTHPPTTSSGLLGGLHFMLQQQP
jgi:hypothetical protein